ncbi:MAG: 1-acyl-sn-glycerol-3-phosphate acyltransferase [Actinobacteria bacterium]|nr:1-acyl-sn-glycerol-3-phosphate acyltransferase [Actinomycetota bacterium]
MFYRVFRAFVLTIFKVVFRVKVEGKEHVPSEGVYVVAPSHRSILDIPFAAYLTRRRIRFMAKKELFSTWIGRKFFQALAAIEVDREVADRSALRTAQEALQSGEPVGVFPEGTRHTGPVLGDMHDGAAYLARRIGVPIVPVGVGGSEKIMERGRLFPRFHKVVVVIGPPLMPEADATSSRRRSEVRALTDQLRTSLQACFDTARRAAGESARDEVGQCG